MSCARLRSAALPSVCAALAFAGGCKARASEAAQAPSGPAPLASAAPGAALASAAALTAKPWYAGGFSGSYEAKLAPVEVSTGAVREWKADDGKGASGPGKLTLQVDDAGLVDGSSEGAFGSSHASGKVEDDTLRVSLEPSDATALHGVLVATREGDGFKGFIQASSGDSLQVRRATVELKKQAN